MAKKILLVFLITFTGRILQSSFRIPFDYVRASHTRVLSNIKSYADCQLIIHPLILTFKSYSCYKKLEPRTPRAKNKLNVIFYASKKRKKPSKRNAKAFVSVPLKNWGTLYFL